MTDFLAIEALINGIVSADTTLKGELGRRFALYLGLTPGEIGRDGGCDGTGEINGKSIYFQSKLEREKMDASRAAEFYGNVGLHQANIGIMLSGAGYTPGFAQRLAKDPYLTQRYEIHLLSLRDLFEESTAFQQAIVSLPPLRNLRNFQFQDLL
ncbi:hypothetical protein ACN4EG_17185 [Alkalinema pantanalense CENA528]|uniref:hypothetical protein n=1 Tax=Alkalinema pantanalense TaxID=1620705 RepID=UPI003D6DEB5C